MPLTTYTAGEVLTAASLNANLSFAASSPAGGLTLVKTQTIGTTVASVEVTGAFSATYDGYLITVSGGVTSGDAIIGLQLGSTTTGYYMSGSVNNFSDGSAIDIGGNNTAAFLRAGHASTNGISLNVDLQNPFLSKVTIINSQVVALITSGNSGNFGGFLNNTTSYTAFTLTPNTGTMTGGTIRIYGYANSQDYMTYEEAVAMYPHDEVHIQIDDVVRVMTPTEYEAFIQKQVNYVPSA